MITIEPLINFQGFGDGKTPGEYYYSQGLMKSHNGLTPAWLINKVNDETDLPDLGLINFFTQAAPVSGMYVYAVDDSGDIYQSDNGLGSWTLAYKPAAQSYGNGLIGDQKNRLLYAGTRYLGKYDGTANYITGTVSVNNSTTVVGSGTTWTAGMVGKRFQVAGDTEFYTITAVGGVTAITLDRPYTGTTGSLKLYIIFTGWNDEWKDFGASSLLNINDFRPSDTYEDWVLWGNNNNVAGLNITDDSFSTSVFNFPSKFFVRCISSGKNGILLGANFGNYGVLALWDNHSPRSIAPWIWLNAPIKTIIKNNGDWIVITGREILLTNGYSVQSIAYPLDSEIDATGFNTLPQGGIVIRDRLMLSNAFSSLNRVKPGAWILNLETGAWEFAPVFNNCLRNVSMGGIFFDSNFKIHIGFTTSNPSKKFIGAVKNNAPSRAVYISHRLGQGANNKAAEGIKLNLGFDQIHPDSYPITFNVLLKIYNFKRPLWTYANVKTIQTVANQVVVDGTSSGVNNAQVGDEITVLEGANAGEIRHVISVDNKDTATETWTLDSNLPNLTQSGVVLNVSPFQLVSKQTLSDVSELRDLYFNAKKRITGKNFLIKVVMENMSGITAVPELQESYFIYDDLGIL